MQDFTWTPISEETYDYRLEALWPACNMKRPRMFLLGEPYDHEGDGYSARYLAHMQDTDGYWTGSRPVTRSEFMALDRRASSSEAVAS